jgi:drug/metabolite transporter (DMT)-like permease
VFAQKTIAIGTIGVASVIQPALAVVWSFLLLSEAVRGWQVAGITVAILGLGAFLVFNERGERSRRAATAADHNLGPRSRVA